MPTDHIVPPYGTLAAWRGSFSAEKYDMMDGNGRPTIRNLDHEAPYEPEI
jgi:hypothetical protein